jgi:hypothetical protein
MTYLKKKFPMSYLYSSVMIYLLKLKVPWRLILFLWIVSKPHCSEFNYLNNQIKSLLKLITLVLDSMPPN